MEDKNTQNFVEDSKRVYESTKDNGQKAYLIVATNENGATMAVKASAIELADMMACVILAVEKDKKNRKLIMKLMKRDISLYEAEFGDEFTVTGGVN